MVLQQKSLSFVAWVSPNALVISQAVEDLETFNPPGEEICTRTALARTLYFVPLPTTLPCRVGHLMLELEYIANLIIQDPSFLSRLNNWHEKMASCYLIESPLVAQAPDTLTRLRIRIYCCILETMLRSLINVSYTFSEWRSTRPALPCFRFPSQSCFSFLSSFQSLALRITAIIASDCS